jgi:hypothetical protein
MIDGLALLLQSPDQSAAAAGGADGGWPLGEMIALGSLALLVAALLFPPTARRLRALLPAREA